MTKKDYVLIAEVLKPYGYNTLDNVFKSHQAIIREIVLSLARALQKENPRFDMDKFLKASDQAV